MLDIARPDDRDRIADVLADAFAADPLFGWVFPDPTRTDGQRRRMMEISAERAIELGHAYVWRADARRSDAGIEGVALWAPPGVPFFGPAEGRRLADLLTGADPDRRALIGAGMGEVHHHQPDEPFFHLQFFGVRSSRRGQGVGASLLGGCLEWIDRLGHIAFLESSNLRNVTVYLRHGFEVVAEVQLPEGPIVRPMLRTARR